MALKDETTQSIDVSGIPVREPNARDVEGALVASRKFIEALQKGYQPNGLMVPDRMLDVLAEFISWNRDEKIQAQRREQAEQARIRIEHDRAENFRETRALVLKRIGQVALMGTILGPISLAGKVLVYDNLSPEAYARWEAQNTLGTNYTGPSSEGWSVRHPASESGVGFEPSQETFNAFYVNDTTYVDFERTGVISNHTGILIGDYTNTKGKWVPRIYVSRPGRSGDSSRYDSVILSSEPVPGVETGVLEFKNVNNQQTRFAAISRPNHNASVYKVQVMNPVRR